MVWYHTTLWLKQDVDQYVINDHKCACENNYMTELGLIMQTPGIMHSHYHAYTKHTCIDHIHISNIYVKTCTVHVPCTGIHYPA